jgi:curved DNA-binding protein CbpA
MSASPEPDPYVVLGVSRTAPDAEIRAAYVALVTRYHPDRHQGNPLEDLAGIKMAEINQAYRTLSDPDRRAAYDQVAAGPGGGSGVGRRSSRAAKVVALLMALPVLVGLGGFLIRALVAIGRIAVESTAGLRGTPFAAGLALLVFASLLIALFRRRRRKRHSR